MEISASIDPCPTVEYVEKLNNFRFVDSIHLDVMDGVFVERKNMDLETYKQIIKAAKKPVDVHLMIDNPEKNIKKYLSKKVRSITVQYEACEKNLNFNIAINPKTKIENVADIIKNSAAITIMSVVAGKSGQEFQKQVLKKIKEAKAINPNIKVIVDGGINDTNVDSVKKKGADIVVMGSHIYKLLMNT